MPPLTVMVKPASGLCNLRCAYCFYSDVASNRATASYGVMSEATLTNLVRRAFAYAEGRLNIASQGGEPTLAGKDFFRLYLSLLRKHNTRGLRVQSAIQTNGYALGEEWCEILKAGDFLTGVSLDGTKALHDACRTTASGEATYDRIERNIALLKRFGVEYNILCVVRQQVAERPREVFDALKAHRYLQFIPCLDGLDGAKSAFSLDSETYGRFLIETFDLYEQAMRSGHPVSIRTFDNLLGMMAGQPPENCAMSGRCGNYYVIEADGGAYPCDFYVLDSWKLGNVNDVSFFTLAQSPVGEAFRRASVPLPQACKACPWLALCRGGCRRDREPFVNGLPSANRLCAGMKLFLEAKYERMRELL